MNTRERENAVLNFSKNIDRGSVEETFFPWRLTVERWLKEGLPIDITNNMWRPAEQSLEPVDYMFNWLMADGVYRFEQYFGLDGVKRFSFNLPIGGYEEIVLEENEEFLIKRVSTGECKKVWKNKSHSETIKYAVESEEDWTKLKEISQKVINNHLTPENIVRIHMPFKRGHDKGDYAVRYWLKGFFDTPRKLFGVENHLYAFYDFPEVIHDINQFILDNYFRVLGHVFDTLPADVVYIMEDLSGKNGPMLSSKHFDEFVGAYYKKLVPFLKAHGVKHILVDTDGDFTSLIPNFLEAGVEGFLPMDVNAGVDIVEVRRKYPQLKLIGGFNKLAIAEGKEAIDKEFERLLPVIRQGGYIPGADHQIAPSTSLENYLYYVQKLKEVVTIG